MSQRRKLILLGTALAALIVIALAVLMMGGDFARNAFAPLLAVTILVAIFALGAFRVDAQISAIDRGDNIIGRWTVSPQEWSRFLERNDALNAGKSVQESYSPRRRQVSASGIEIIFSTTAVRIGDAGVSLSVLGQKLTSAGGVIDGDPRVLELGGSKRSPYFLSHWACRVPIAEDAMPQAETVRRFYLGQQD